MGAGQSNNKQPLQEVKTSYYELLEIEKTATPEEIKKAYRRKALELHPDRNFGDVERATTLFAAVQSAYEVLSDPQERAWYDSHEDAILRDIDPHAQQDQPDAYERNVGLTTADDITRLFRRFNANVEFTDSPTGFFGFLRELFEKLAGEEEFAARRVGEDVVDYPSFGHKDDRHEDVVKTFYAVWSSFATRKSFSWRDKYRQSDGVDRRMRRLIDKENKRFRDEGIHEFNDAVRSLVAFVKKRDPRYKPNTQSEQERQNALREAAKAQAARQRAANLAKMDAEVLPEWAKTREPHDDVEIFDEESEEEQFECVACRKTFKSDKQFQAHEKSKKHIKTVQALRRKLQKEGHDLDLDDDEAGASTPAREHDGEEGLVDGSEFTEVNGTGPSMENSTLDISQEDLNSSFDKLNTEDDEEDADDDSSIVATDPAEESTKSEDIDTPRSSSPEQSESALHRQPPAPKMGKAAQKRAKKAAQTASDTTTPGADNRCATCNATFPSRTQLFQHIKDHGHAAPVPAKGKGGARAKKN